MQPILKPRKGTRPLQGPAPDPAPRRALPGPPEASSQRRRQRGTHGAVVRLRLRSVNWPIQARPAYVDVTGLGEGFQQLQQRPRIQIVVVIYVAEPSQPTGQEGIKFSGHLAGKGRVAVFRRAVGDHKVGPQSLLEAFIQAVSEDERLGMRKESGQGSVKESPGSAHRQVQVDTHISDLCPPSVIEIHSCHSHTLL